MATLRSISLTAALLASMAVFAQTPAEHAAHHPDQAASAPAPMAMPGGMAQMDDHMKAMRAMHDKMMRAKTAKQRQALMAGHMKMMEQGMSMMGGMGGGMRMGMGIDMGAAARPGAAASASTDPQMRQQMMEKRMDMMQSMMQMMMDRMQATEPAAK